MVGAESKKKKNKKKREKKREQIYSLFLSDLFYVG